MRRVLSLWQPWATLCVVPDPSRKPPLPPKAWETRHWKPKLTPPFDVAIHATKRIEKQLLEEWPFLDAIVRCGIEVFPRGAIIGVATVAEFAFTENLKRAWSIFEDGGAEEFAEQIAFGDYSPGRWAWRLDNAIALPEPIPFRGQQAALYDVPDWIEKQINDQLAEATI